MVDDAARQIERGLAPGRRDLEDDVGPDGRLQRRRCTSPPLTLISRSSASMASSAGGHPDLAGDADGDARVLAPARRAGARRAGSGRRSRAWPPRRPRRPRWRRPARACAAGPAARRSPCRGSAPCWAARRRPSRPPPRSRGRARSWSGRTRLPSGHRAGSAPRTPRGSGSGRAECSRGLQGRLRRLVGAVRRQDRGRYEVTARIAERARGCTRFCSDPCPFASTSTVRCCLPEEAKVSVFDRGFLYGDSVYETIGTAYGRLFAARRSPRSARALGRAHRPARPAARRDRARHRRDGRRGRQRRVAGARHPHPRRRQARSRSGLAPSDTRLVVIVFPLGPPTPEMFEKGVAVAIVSVARNSPAAIDPAVKSGNYLNNVLALGEARRRVEGLRGHPVRRATAASPRGRPATSSWSCGGEVRTPPPEVGILDGITRAKVIELCRETGIPLRRAPRCPPTSCAAADEAFITSATRGVLPVTRSTSAASASGVPGPVTRR